MSKKTFTVVFERDESGWWVATVHGLQGVHTQGRTVAQARDRIREALRAAGEDADATLIDNVQLPPELRTRLELARATRGEAANIQSQAQKAMRRAALAFRRRGISVRDAGELLDISYQRVQQLLGPAAPTKGHGRKHHHRD